jgi:HEAT repeat protein
MTLKILFSILLFASASQASIPELVQSLSSTNLAVQTQARLDLLAVCSNASRPDADAGRRAVCLEICAELENDLSPLVVSQLVRNLQRIGDVESVPTLVKLLSASDAHVRDDARQALAVNPSPEAGQALSMQLMMRKARAPRETAGLIYALGERRQAGASNLIAPYLGNQDRLIFTATAKALSRLNEEEGIRALITQRANETGARKAMLDAELFETDRIAVFEKLYAASQPEEVRAVALLGLVMNNGAKSAAAALDSGNPALQTAVIEGASQSQTPKLYDLVAKQLPKLPPQLQVQALGALEFSDNRDYAKSVEPLLNSADEQIQVAAAQALGRIGTAKSVPVLLSSGTGESRRALGILNAKGVDKILEKEAANKGDDARRAVAIEALALRGRRDLISDFFAYASEEGQDVSIAGVKAIGLIGNLSNLEALTKLMIKNEKSRLSRDILQSIVDIMRRSTAPGEAVAVLVSQMDGASPRSQSLILQALAQVGNQEALQSILAACLSTDEVLQKQAIKLLGEWKNNNALPDMLGLASDESFSLANHVILMRGISRLLAKQKKLDEPTAIQAFGICRRPDEKKLLIPTLGKAKTPEAKAILKACLADPELQVDAEEALKPKGKGKGKGKKKK